MSVIQHQHVDVKDIEKSLIKFITYYTTDTTAQQRLLLVCLNLAYLIADDFNFENCKLSVLSNPKYHFMNIVYLNETDVNTKIQNTVASCTDIFNHPERSYLRPPAEAVFISPFKPAFLRAINRNFNVDRSIKTMDAKKTLLCLTYLAIKLSACLSVTKFLVSIRYIRDIFVKWSYDVSYTKTYGKKVFKYLTDSTTTEEGVIEMCESVVFIINCMILGIPVSESIPLMHTFEIIIEILFRGITPLLGDDVLDKLVLDPSITRSVFYHDLIFSIGKTSGRLRLTGIENSNATRSEIIKHKTKNIEGPTTETYEAVYVLSPDPNMRYTKHDEALRKKMKQVKTTTVPHIPRTDCRILVRKDSVIFVRGTYMGLNRSSDSWESKVEKPTFHLKYVEERIPIHTFRVGCYPTKSRKRLKHFIPRLRAIDERFGAALFQNDDTVSTFITYLGGLLIGYYDVHRKSKKKNIDRKKLNKEKTEITNDINKATHRYAKVTRSTSKK
jgi:hypothetical protein